MAKTPKSVTVVLGLVITGIQAIAELIKVVKTEEKKDDKEGDGRRDRDAESEGGGVGGDNW